MECGGARRSRGTWQEPRQVSKGELVARTRVRASRWKEADERQTHTMVVESLELGDGFDVVVGEGESQE